TQLEKEAQGARRGLSQSSTDSRPARAAPAAASRGALGAPFAHLYETGGMRRVHLRGHSNILKRLLIHIGGFNLGLLMRQLIGVGTPRGLQGRLSAVLATLLTLIRMLSKPLTSQWCPNRRFSLLGCCSIARYVVAHIRSIATAFTTGC